jgi:hypothetical protein
VDSNEVISRQVSAFSHQLRFGDQLAPRVNLHFAIFILQFAYLTRHSAHEAVTSARVIPVGTLPHGYCFPLLADQSAIFNPKCKFR